MGEDGAMTAPRVSGTPRRTRNKTVRGVTALVPRAPMS